VRTVHDRRSGEDRRHSPDRRRIIRSWHSRLQWLEHWAPWFLHFLMYGFILGIVLALIYAR